MRYILYAAKPFCMVILFIVIAPSASAQNLADNEIKTNVTTISDPLRSILALEPRSFEYRTRQFSHLQLPPGTHYGFIAEEFRQVFPGMVYRKPYSYMAGKNSYRNATINTINMEALIPVLVASIKQQQQTIEELKVEIEALKRR
jgi:hypothetical protein